MKKIEVMLFFTRDFCKECDNEVFYDKLLSKKITVKELKDFLTHDDIGDLNSIVDSQMSSKTGFKNFEYDFTKIKSLKKPTGSANGIRVHVEAEVKSVKQEKSQLSSFLGF